MPFCVCKEITETEKNEAGGRLSDLFIHGRTETQPYLGQGSRTYANIQPFVASNSVEEMEPRGWAGRQGCWGSEKRGICLKGDIGRLQ